MPSWAALLDYWSVEAKSSDYAVITTFWSRLTGILQTLVHLPSRRDGPDAPYGALGFHFLH